MKDTKEKKTITFSLVISEFLEFLRDCEQKYKMADADEQESNEITQDLLHYLELKEHTYHEFASLGKRQKEIRIKRRNAKDIMSQTAPIVTWANENPTVIKSLEKLLGEVRKAERNTQNRVYTPRTNEVDTSNTKLKKQ